MLKRRLYQHTPSYYCELHACRPFRVTVITLRVMPQLPRYSLKLMQMRTGRYCWLPTRVLGEDSPGFPRYYLTCFGSKRVTLLMSAVTSTALVCRVLSTKKRTNMRRPSALSSELSVSEESFVFMTLVVILVIYYHNLLLQAQRLLIQSRVASKETGKLLFWPHIRQLLCSSPVRTVSILNDRIRSMKNPETQ